MRWSRGRCQSERSVLSCLQVNKEHYKSFDFTLLNKTLRKGPISYRHSYQTRLFFKCSIAHAFSFLLLDFMPVTEKIRTKYSHIKDMFTSPCYTMFIIQLVLFNPISYSSVQRSCEKTVLGAFFVCMKQKCKNS